MNLTKPALPHREYFPTHQRTYWRDNSASDAERGNRVEIIIANMARMTFDWPTDRRKLETIEDMLSSAFNAGRADKLKEIKQVLEIKDPRA